MTRTADLKLAAIAASPGPVHERAQALLAELHDHVPFDGAWMALAEPGGTGYTSLASTDLEASSVRYLSGPQMASDIELTGADHERPPTSLSDVPWSPDDLQTWAECLLPAGFHETLSAALFEDGGRHVGFITVLFQSKDPPSQAVRRQLARVLPRLAAGIDPVRALGAAAALISGARAGVVLLPGDGVDRLPGLCDDELLAAGSALVAAARDAISEGANYVSFLWPRGSRELEVLGHLVEGCSNLEIARALGVAPRTVAAHLEHILCKLDAPSRTLAAVRAARAGLYVPLARAGSG